MESKLTTHVLVHSSSGEGEGAVPGDSHMGVPIFLALQADQKCSLLSSSAHWVQRTTLASLSCLLSSLSHISCLPSLSLPPCSLSLHLSVVFLALSLHVPCHSQIPRYILTLHELLAHTPHEHVERNSLDYAKSKLEELSR